MRIAFLDRERAIAELRDAARRLLARDPRVLAVGLFGSLARGQALPSSDADVLIVLRDHPQPRWFDRITEYAEAFTETSLPVEPFAYTYDELRQMLGRRVGFIQTIWREMMPSSGDDGLWQSLPAR
ncbi:nucleotidyltransferase domain-containing protein [Desulfosoma sp.]